MKGKRLALGIAAMGALLMALSLPADVYAGPEECTEDQYVCVWGDDMAGYLSIIQGDAYTSLSSLNFNDGVAPDKRGVVGRAYGDNGTKVGVYAEAEGTGENYGLQCKANDGTNAYGLQAEASGASNMNYALEATADGGTNAYGLWADAKNATTYNYGVWARAQGATTSNTGVEGYATGSGGSYYTGVYGIATGSGVNKGVCGIASGGTENYAGYFNGDVAITGGSDHFKYLSDHYAYYNVPGNTLIADHGAGAGYDYIARHYSGYAYINGSSSPYYISTFAPVNIPNGAIIEEFRCNFYDADDVGYVMAHLARTNKTGSVNWIVVVQTTQGDQSGFYEKYTDDIPGAYEEIENDQYNYFVRVYFYSQYHVGYNYVRFYNCRIKFSYKKLGF